MDIAKVKGNLTNEYGTLTDGLIEAAQMGDPLAQILLAPHITIKEPFNVLAHKYKEKEN